MIIVDARECGSIIGGILFLLFIGYVISSL